jgi:hypothetical protein
MADPMKDNQNESLLTKEDLQPILDNINNIVEKVEHVQYTIDQNLEDFKLIQKALTILQQDVTNLTQNVAKIQTSLGKSTVQGKLATTTSSRLKAPHKNKKPQSNPLSIEKLVKNTLGSPLFAFAGLGVLVLIAMMLYLLGIIEPSKEQKGKPKPEQLESLINTETKLQTNYD